MPSPGEVALDRTNGVYRKTGIANPRGDSNPRYRLRGTTVFEGSLLGTVPGIACPLILSCEPGIPFL